MVRQGEDFKDLNYGWVWSGTVRRGMARQGKVGIKTDLIFGEAWYGLARYRLVGCSMVWSGEVMQGKVRIKPDLFSW